MTTTTLEQDFDRLAKTALKVKRDRDELLDACKDALIYLEQEANLRPAKIVAAIARAEAV
jgi:hypothetical protein